MPEGSGANPCAFSVRLSTTFCEPAALCWGATLNSEITTPKAPTLWKTTVLEGPCGETRLQSETAAHCLVPAPLGRGLSLVWCAAGVATAVRVLVASTPQRAQQSHGGLCLPLASTGV